MDVIHTLYQLGCFFFLAVEPVFISLGFILSSRIPRWYVLHFEELLQCFSKHFTHHQKVPFASYSCQHLLFLTIQWGIPNNQNSTEYWGNDQALLKSVKHNKNDRDNKTTRGFASPLRYFNQRRVCTYSVPWKELHGNDYSDSYRRYLIKH